MTKDREIALKLLEDIKQRKVTDLSYNIDPIFSLHMLSFRWENHDVLGYRNFWDGYDIVVASVDLRINWWLSRRIARAVRQAILKQEEEDRQAAISEILEGLNND